MPMPQIPSKLIFQDSNPDLVYDQIIELAAALKRLPYDVVGRSYHITGTIGNQKVDLTVEPDLEPLSVIKDWVEKLSEQSSKSKGL